MDSLTKPLSPHLFIKVGLLDLDRLTDNSLGLPLDCQPSNVSVSDSSSQTNPVYNILLQKDFCFLTILQHFWTTNCFLNSVSPPARNTGTSPASSCQLHSCQPSLMSTRTQPRKRHTFSSCCAPLLIAFESFIKFLTLSPQSVLLGSPSTHFL